MNQLQALETPVRFRTAAEWWDALGHVPLERIVFEPAPGTATDEDVIRLDDHEDRLCELVDGTLVEKPRGYEESAIAMEIGRRLGNFVVPRKLGVISGPDGMMKILARRVRIPDVAFVSAQRLPQGRMPDKPIPEMAPDLAVEVLSDSNTRAEMEGKLREYFAAGTRLVWYVDPKSKSIDVYTSPDASIRLAGADHLDGGSILPGFQAALSEIFDVIAG